VKFYVNYTWRQEADVGYSGSDVFVGNRTFTPVSVPTVAANIENNEVKLTQV
jgi:hypothetical protein